MFEHKNKKIELISVFPYREEDNWFFRLIYQVEDTKNGEIKDIIIPKCANPFSEKCLELHHREIPLDNYIIESTDLPEPISTCQLINEYCKLPVLLAYDDSIKGSKPYFYGETIIKPATKEMTLKEIEKELGYKVRIKED